MVDNAHRGSIRTLITNYVSTDGSQDLRSYAGAGHDILTYWGDDVRIIEAAKSIAGLKDKVHRTPDRIKSYGGRYFAFNVYYQRFYCYNAIVHTQRVSNYSLFWHAEFFAELYSAYYADGLGTDRGRRLAGVANWKTFFDNQRPPDRLTIDERVGAVHELVAPQRAGCGRRGAGGGHRPRRRARRVRRADRRRQRRCGGIS